MQQYMRIPSKFIPKSLFNRFLIIILLPSIIVQVTIIYIFYYNHINNLNRHMAESMSNQIHLIYQLHKSNQHNDILDSEIYDIGTKIIKNQNIDPKYYNYKIEKFLGFINLFPVIDSFTYLRESLENKDIELFTIYSAQDKNRVMIDIQLNSNILQLNLPKKKVITTRRDVFVAWIIITSLITSLIAILFIKNQIKSIKDLKINAEKLGRGIDVINFKIKGASEIRSLGVSLIRMKERINRHINQKILMLSGVSHDLRTLLTRMKLQIAVMKKDQKVKNLESDINDMEIMIDEYLEFTKESRSKFVENINAKRFFDNIISSYNNSDHNIYFNNKINNSILISCKENNLKRAIRNIIGNSLKYASNTYINIAKNKKNIIIKIDDDGAGVPKKDLENIFKPFYRVDSSRNLDIIGTGLGLSITKDIINAHGGKIEARKSSYGGLSIKIILPI